MHFSSKFQLSNGIIIMNKNYVTKEVKLDDLVLDKENPRFAELYNGSSIESDIVEYLLFTEAAEDLTKAIIEANEFYDDRPLWVYEVNGKYIVKDGNRRCAAVKALQTPNKYNLGLPRFEIEKLPVLEYYNLSDLEKRIRLEHTSNLFKKWGRIAKAIEVYRLFKSGSSWESLTEIDSKPKEFIKIGSFYQEASKIRGEDFKRLVREGRGETGGKTYIFERMFALRNKCGYSFKQKTNEITINNLAVFESYINTIVDYLIKYPKTSSRTIENMGIEEFLVILETCGFAQNAINANAVNANATNANATNANATNANATNANATNANATNANATNANATNANATNANATNTNATNANATNANVTNANATNANATNANATSTNLRYSVKTRPTLKRKKIPPALKKLIDECYNLKENDSANAKIALTRISFECTLKFVVENTMNLNGRFMKDSSYFDPAFKRGRFTNFEELKKRFTSLVIDTGIKTALNDFDLQRSHQIIHNYHVGAIPNDAKTLCDNLVVLIDFMLEDESVLITSLDMSKL